MGHFLHLPGWDSLEFFIATQDVTFLFLSWLGWEQTLICPVSCSGLLPLEFIPFGTSLAAGTAPDGLGDSQTAPWLGGKSIFQDI